MMPSKSMPSKPMIEFFTRASCRRIAPLLWAQSEGAAQLSSGETGRVSSHLARCAACRAESALIAETGAFLRQNAPIPAVPPADLWNRIEAEIAPAPVPGAFAPAKPFAPALGGMAWAGSLAIVVVGGAWMSFGGGFLHRASRPAANPSRAAVQTPAPNASASVSVILPPPVLASVQKAAVSQSSRVSMSSPAPSLVPASPKKRSVLVASAKPARAPRRARIIAEASSAAPLVRQSEVAPAFAVPAAPASAVASLPIANTAPLAVSAARSAPHPAEPDAPGSGGVAETVAAPVLEETQTIIVSAKPAGVLYAAAVVNRSNFAILASDAEPTVPPAGSRARSFSVADSTAQTQRQQALFSYGHP